MSCWRHVGVFKDLECEVVGGGLLTFMYRLGGRSTGAKMGERNAGRWPVSGLFVVQPDACRPPPLQVGKECAGRGEIARASPLASPQSWSI